MRNTTINELNKSFSQWASDCIQEIDDKKTNSENRLINVITTMIKSMDKAGDLPQEFKQMLHKYSDDAISNGSTLGAKIKKSLK